MRKKQPIDYVVDNFVTALQDLPMYIEDYERPKDKMLEIFEDVFSVEVLEAINNMEG